MEPSRQQGRCPSGVQWDASVTAGLTSLVSLAAFAGSSLTANSSPGWGAKSLLSRSLNTASVGLASWTALPQASEAPEGKQHQALGHTSVMPASEAEAGDGEFRASLDYIGIPCLNESNTIQTEQETTPAASLNVASPSYRAESQTWGGDPRVD